MKANKFRCFVLLSLSMIVNSCHDSGTLIKPPQKTNYPCADNCVYYRVENLYPLKQPTQNSCWATVLTMLLSWKENKKLEIEDVMGRYGAKYTNLYDKSDEIGIGVDDEMALYKQAGLTIMQQLNPSIEGWESYLKEYGPLSVTLDANPPFGGTVHAVLITGIFGTVDGKHTDISYIDPLDGNEHIMKFMDFLKMYEAKYSVDWQIQIVGNNVIK